MLQNLAQAILQDFFFERFVPTLLGLLVPNSNVFNIWGPIHAYLCQSLHSIFLLFPYCAILKGTTPGILGSAACRSGFDGGRRQNDQLPALVGGSLEMSPKTMGRSLVKHIDHLIGR